MRIVEVMIWKVTDRMTLKEKQELLQLLETKDKLQHERIIKSDSKLFASECLHIIDKKGNDVNLAWNDAQQTLFNMVEQMRAEGLPPRIIMLKARQVGASTGTQGYLVEKTTQHSNKSALIIAHDDDAVNSIFSKAKYMYDNLPDWCKPLQKASNAKELIFDTPSYYQGKQKGLNSKIRVRIAGKTGIGRGDTPKYVHISEFAFWTGTGENSPNKQLMGVLSAVPKELDTLVIIESTANGMNDFKEYWDNAVSGKNSFRPLFFAWHNHEEYISDFTSSREIDDFINSMSEYEIYLKNDLNLPIERIKWWRDTFTNDCNSNLEHMKQENPSTPEEAFIMSGSSVFDNDKVSRRIEYLRQHSPLIKQGYFEFEWNDSQWKDFIKIDTISFVESNQKAFIRLYEEAKKDYPYVIGGDTKGEGKDSYAATVINNNTQARCATVELDVNNSKPYAWQLFCLGHYFNKALIGIEMNFNTGPLEELERLHYNNQYVREVTDSYTGQLQKKFGWKTDGITRPLMIDDEISLTEHHIDLINDIPTLQQMLTFVYDNNKRPDALSGHHDDLLFSDQIANQIKIQQTCSIKHREQFNLAKLPKDLQEDYLGATKDGKAYLKSKWTKIGMFD